MKQTLILEKNKRNWQLFNKSEKKFPFLWHYHDECELFVPLAGQWKYLIGNMQGDIGPGEAFLLPPRLPHSFFTLTQTTSCKPCCYVLFFNLPLSDFDQIAEFNVSDTLRKRFYGGARLRVPPALSDSLNSLNRCDAGLPAVAAFAGILHSLLHTPMTALLAQRSVDYSGVLQSSDAITQIGDYLARHSHEKLTLAQIADATCFSVPTMCRLFRQGTGHSIFGYMRELRLSRVKLQLAWTNQSITDIALSSGFASQGSFYRAFHDATGHSPAAYRRMIRNGTQFGRKQS